MSGRKKVKPGPVESLMEQRIPDGEWGEFAAQRAHDFVFLWVAERLGIRISRQNKIQISYDLCDELLGTPYSLDKILRGQSPEDVARELRQIDARRSLRRIG